MSPLLSLSDISLVMTKEEHRLLTKILEDGGLLTLRQGMRHLDKDLLTMSIPVSAVLYSQSNLFEPVL